MEKEKEEKQKYLQSTIRFDSDEQWAKWKKAARAARYTLNSFMLNAGDRLADEILKTLKNKAKNNKLTTAETESGQTRGNDNQLTLNQ